MNNKYNPARNDGETFADYKARQWSEREDLDITLKGVYIWLSVDAKRSTKGKTYKTIEQPVS